MMCDENKSRIHLYLDGELQPAEALLLETHLVECPSCRAEYESLVSVVETVRAAQPLYQPSEECAHRAQQVVSAHRRRLALYRGAIAASILLIAALAWEAFSQRMARQDRFAAFAAEAHLRYERGALPLDIRTEEPKAVAEWLSRRLPFHLTLPNYPEQTGHAKKYSLVGARLLQYREEDVAYLSYQMDRHPISLLMASSARILPSGGELFRSGGLTFHSTSRDGLQMITWVDKGLSYALVSDLGAVGAESCAICHGREDDRRKFERLRWH
jgi:anti-sigma factor RsiW